MKLCRYGPLGQEKPGLVDADGRIRSLADHADFTSETLAPDALALSRPFCGTGSPISCGWNIGTTSVGPGCIIRNSANGELWRVITK
jgi:hypothetical protein